MHRGDGRFHFCTGAGAGGDQPVHCDSPDNGRHYCGRAHVRYPFVAPANSNCKEGQTWGSGEHGVWVSGGCSGDFDGFAVTSDRHH